MRKSTANAPLRNALGEVFSGGQDSRFNSKFTDQHPEHSGEGLEDERTSTSRAHMSVMSSYELHREVNRHGRVERVIFLSKQV